MSTTPRSVEGDEEYIWSKLLTPKEAAKYLNISESWLRKARVTGREDAPTFIKIGRSVRYSLQSLETYLKERERKNTLYFS